MTDYRNTLNLPQTEFPMRGNLSNLEVYTLKNWYKNNLYEILRKEKKGKKKFLIHDGPPYANGPIHIGHAVNKILKDIIIKSKGLMGYDAPYIPGWDCHGLPIELKVEKLFCMLNKNIDLSEFQNSCRHYALKEISKQKDDFIRLGIIGDWDNSYSTMNFVTEANTIRTLSKIITNGYLYRGTKPVHWCRSCRSALAESEVEYKDHVSYSIDTTFVSVNSDQLLEKLNIRNFFGSIMCVIWTTTPWTLPANRALAIHPEFNYQIVNVNGVGLILLENLVIDFMKRINCTDWKILRNIKGRDLGCCRFDHPFMNFNVPIVFCKNIEKNVGTGIIHIAPGHGYDDYIIGLKNSLEIANIVDDNGCYLEGTFESLDGKFVLKTNEIIFDLLRKSNSLLHIKKTQHNYPYCWRHKTPIIYRSTEQWFINMDHNFLRDKILLEIKKTKWIPSWGKDLIHKMIIDRPDWCISRQRVWGVPITLFTHKKTKKLHPNTEELMEKIAKKIEEDGIQSWWNLNIADILNSNDIDCYEKVTDVLDVWFDSGSTCDSIVTYPSTFSKQQSDLYLEGNDQYRGWFMSSLIISTALKGYAPCKTWMTHGFVVDKTGNKMSKSIGNTINPKHIIEKFGSDVFRLWVASTNYTNEITISNDVLQRSADIYRRIRNTARFLLSNLYDFNPEKDFVHIEEMVKLDIWIIGKAKILQKKIIKDYNNYNFHNIVKNIMHFCSIELGSFYLDVTKDRQYTTKNNSLIRRSCQTAFYHIIEALVRWISPILSFTANEIWKFIPGVREKYVFTEEWYNNLFELNISEEMNNAYWDSIIQVRNEVNKIIEHERSKKKISGSLETHVILYAKSNIAIKLRKLEKELHFVFLTSSATIRDYSDNRNTTINNQEKNIIISLKKARENKCQRCWHHDVTVGKNVIYPDICDRCILNTIGIGEERKFV